MKRVSAIVFGDTQFHPWMEAESHSHWRVNLVDRFGKMLVGYAAHCNATDVIFMGDLFESKRAIRGDVVTAVADMLRSVTTNLARLKRPPRLIAIAGNHDYYGSGVDDCILNAVFPRLWTCVERAPMYDARSRSLFVPYGASPKHLRSEARADDVWGDSGVCATDVVQNIQNVFSHVSWHGVSFLRGGAESAATGYSAHWYRELSRFGAPTKVQWFNGHYHTPRDRVEFDAPGAVREKLEGYLIGAPYQHNWADCDEKTAIDGADVPDRGLCHVQLDASGMEKTYPEACVERKSLARNFPRFYTSDANALKINDFVRNRISTQPSTQSSKVATPTIRPEAQSIGGAELLDAVEKYVRVRQGIGNGRLTKSQRLLVEEGKRLLSHGQ